MSREAAGKVRQNVSLAPHVREALRAQAAAAGLDVSAYVATLVMREEERRGVEQRAREGVPPRLATALERGKRSSAWSLRAPDPPADPAARGAGPRQEVHWCAEDRIVPAVTSRPDHVWVLRGPREQRPALPFVPVHRRNAWSLDVGHDWSMHGPGGCLRYSPGGGEHTGEWLLCEWNG